MHAYSVRVIAFQCVTDIIYTETQAEIHVPRAKALCNDTLNNTCTCTYVQEGGGYPFAVHCINSIQVHSDDELNAINYLKKAHEMAREGTCVCMCIMYMYMHLYLL